MRSFSFALLIALPLSLSLLTLAGCPGPSEPDAGDGDGDGDPIEYSAINQPGGLDRVFIDRHDPNTDTCTRIVMVWPGQFMNFNRNKLFRSFPRSAKHCSTRTTSKSSIGTLSQRTFCCKRMEA